MNIYYLGPVGSYSHIVAQKMFDQNKYELVPVDRFTDVVNRVQKDGMGILGIENSISSSVHESVDQMFQSDLHIIGEAIMNIQLHVGGKKGTSLDSISQIYSHSQALAQCSDFISKNHLRTHKTSSTAAAIEHVAESNNVSFGAIGDKTSIEKKDLSIISEYIGNTKHNMTRWIIISKNSESLFQPINKVTYIFRVKHEPGSLVRVLQSIGSVKGNMTKIESRPVPGSDWEYEFWVDVEIAEGSLDQIDKSIARETSTHRRIGAYKKGTLYTE